MAQISYIKYTDILEENRMDAEFHRIVFYNNQLKYVKIEDILTFLQYGISIDMNESGVGYKIYRMNEIENMFCSQKVSKYADISNKEMDTFKLEDRDVLFNRTNSFEFVGRTGIFKKFSQENLVFASYLVRARTDEKKVLPEYLVAFLNTKYGIFDIKRRARISINQSNVSASELKKIKIPLIDLNIQKKIKELFDISFQKQTQSKQLYREAEELLLRELRLSDYQVKHSLWFTATKKEADEAHRYDSEYFQPKYAEIIKKIEKYDGGWDLVKNMINFKDKNYTPKNDQKYKYLALSNISSQGYVQDYQEEFGKDLPSRARRKINTNDLIISSIEGSLSSCALVEKEFDNSICSTGFFVLSSKKINSETLLILFKSLVIQELLQRGSKGTILTAISKTELESIKIPLIKPSIQKQVAEKIQESHRLRKESKDLLEKAKRKVEEEIEKE